MTATTALPARAAAQAPSSAGLAIARAAAAVAVILIAARIEIATGVTIGMAAAFALTPFWWPVLRRYWGGRLFLIASVIAILVGLWLNELSSVDHAIGSTATVVSSLLILGLAASVAVILWARTLFRDSTVAVLFGVGLFLGVTPTSSLYASNPWRFGFAVAITVIVLALASATRTRWIELVAILGFTGVAAVTDARSSFALLLLAAIFVLWQLVPRRKGRRTSALAVVIVLAGLAIVVYNLGQALILDGYLGESTRARTELQLDTSGSLILGGRPELAASIALISHQPWGYGSGVVPTLADITIAKTGMAAINYQPNNGYVENYMFGADFELHSVIGDLWADFGFGGFLLAGTILFLLLRGLGTNVARRSASGIVLYVIVKSLWNLPFGPLYSSVTLLTLALGLALLPRERHPS